MFGGLLFSVIGFYILYYSFEKGPVFRRMSAEELEIWRETKKKSLRVVGVLIIIAGIAQAAGLAIAFQ